MKTALITGVAGQDGSYLSRLLLDKGYTVIGVMKHRTSMENIHKLELFPHHDLTLVNGDITDPDFVQRLIDKYSPNEIYNLAAQSHVGHSFAIPHQTCAVNYTGYLNILLAARRSVPNAKIYQAGTSEMFGYAAKNGTQNEQTPFMPKSPYAIAKTAAYWAGVNARYEADQFICNGILFNHESPLRHEDFVTRKITKAVGRIARGEDYVLRLGNLDSQRDWGHARDYVEGMWMIMQHEKPDDYILATGETYSVRAFVYAAFRAAGIKLVSVGKGIDEKFYFNSKLVCEIDPQFYRPNELEYLCGDFTKAKTILNWRPKTGFQQLVEEMVKEDMK